MQHMADPDTERPAAHVEILATTIRASFVYQEVSVTG